MASNVFPAEDVQVTLKVEEEEATNKSIKLEDREWQLNKTLTQAMGTLYEKQLWTDITFTFDDQVQKFMIEGVNASSVFLFLHTLKS